MLHQTFHLRVASATIISGVNQGIPKPRHLGPVVPFPSSTSLFLTTNVSEWVTVRKPKELVSASVSVIAVAKKETVKTPKDPDRSLGFGTREHG